MVIDNGPKPPEDGPDNPTTDMTTPAPEADSPAVSTLNANPSFVMPGDEPA